LTAETQRTAETSVLFSADSAVLSASAVDLVAILHGFIARLKVAQNIANQWFVSLQKSAMTARVGAAVFAWQRRVPVASCGAGIRRSS
jgi:hypothetical protein